MFFVFPQIPGTCCLGTQTLRSAARQLEASPNQRQKSTAPCKLGSKHMHPLAFFPAHLAHTRASFAGASLVYAGGVSPLSSGLSVPFANSTSSPTRARSLSRASGGLHTHAMTPLWLGSLEDPWLAELLGLCRALILTTNHCPGQRIAWRPPHRCSQAEGCAVRRALKDS